MFVERFILKNNKLTLSPLSLLYLGLVYCVRHILNRLYLDEILIIFFLCSQVSGNLGFESASPVTNIICEYKHEKPVVFCGNRIKVCDNITFSFIRTFGCRSKIFWFQQQKFYFLSLVLWQQENRFSLKKRNILNIAVRGVESTFVRKISPEKGRHFDSLIVAPSRVAPFVSCSASLPQDSFSLSSTRDWRSPHD